METLLMPFLMRKPMFSLKPVSPRLLTFVFTFLLTACGGGEETSDESRLAHSIRNDARLPLVRAKAGQLVARELTAGSGYPAVFIRDLNTFVELAIEGQGAQKVRSQLEQFLEHQGEDGNIVDGITVQDGSTFKATVESDQESSLVQAVGKYVAITGDKAFLIEDVSGVSVIERLEKALMFLYKQRFSAGYCLVFGGTRADWATYNQKILRAST